MNRLLRILPALAVATLPAVAQQSASFRQDEHVTHAGGRPAQGAIASSASFRVSLDAVGSPVRSGSSLASASFRTTVGFVIGVRPAGETSGLRFEDKDTLSWSPDDGVGTYSIYRGTIDALGGATWGACFAHGSAVPQADDAAPVPVGEAFGYLVAARDRLAVEATLGTSSAGAPRQPIAACP